MKKVLYFLTIIIFSIICMLPYYKEVNLYGHDSTFHIANIEALSNSGDITTPKIVEDVANNFGYGTYIFYPPLPHTVSLYTYNTAKIFGLDIYIALAIVYTLITIASATIVFILAKKVLKNDTLGLLSSVIFAIMPFSAGIGSVLTLTGDSVK